MAEDPKRSLRIQKATEDFERRLQRMEKRIGKLRATQRNINNPSTVPATSLSVPADPLSVHDELLGLEDDDHPQYPLKTGWGLGLDETNVTISMNDGTRTFTLTAVLALGYWIQGIHYDIKKGGTDTVVIDDTEGIWFIYYVANVLTASQTPWDIAASDKTMVAVVYWDATNNASITVGWEFHSWVMDPATHEENHHTLGTRFRSGLAVADAGGELLDVTAGIIYDEDIKIDIADGAGSTLFEQVLSPAELPLLYRDGANGDWRKIAATTSPVIVQAGALKLNKLNGVWALVSVTALRYICYWILATDDIAEPVISIPGQVEGTSVQAVRDANPLSSMSFGDLPVAEYKVIARVIVQEAVADPFYSIDSIDDFRDVSTEPGTGTTITDHSSLTGVTTSQHHVKYTNVEVEAVITAELIDGQSIDVAIDNLIETHGLIYNAHHSIDDTPVDGELEEPISSNWAFDHAASPANVNHLTDAQIAALHAEVDPFPSGEYYVGSSTFTTSASQTDVFSDGSRDYHQFTGASGWMHSNDNPMPIKLTINGTTKYLKITKAKVFWIQAGAADDLSRVLIKHHVDDGTITTVKDDPTDRGAAGFNSFEYTTFANNQADANTLGFSIIIYSVAHSPASDWKLDGVRFTFEYV